MLSKENLRRKYQSKRDQLSAEEVEASSIAIANNILKLEIWSKRIFHIFLSIDRKKEVQTQFVIQVLQGRDKDIVISKSNFENLEMQHYLLTDQTVLRVSNWGIPEPINQGINIEPHQIDVVFVPLLAADRLGNRVGYGKGFYDRFLSKCRPDCLKIGLSLFEVEEGSILKNDDDISLDILVTPTMNLRF